MRRASRARGAALLGLALVGLALLACGRDGRPEGASVATPPHVILIVIDTLRADHLGVYGYARDTSPHIDALARDALVYERATAQAPWTTPSIGSLLTSLQPATLGIEGNQSSIADEHVLLSEVFHDRGFATGAVVSHSFCSSRWNFDQGFDVFDESNVRGHLAVTSPSVTDRGLEFIEAHASEPFFLWLHYFDPHVAYIEHPETSFPRAGGYSGPIASGQDFKTLRSLIPSLRPEDVAELHRLYDSEIAFTDRAVGRLLATLKERGLYDDAVIVLAADHGEEFMERGDLGHAKTVYQELIHVPLVVKLPGVAPRRVAQPVALVDVYPSLLAYLGLPVPDGLAGRSLLPEALAAADPERPILSETRRGGLWRALVAGDVKLIVDPHNGHSELYHLDVDPGERDDRSAREPQTVARLRARMAPLFLAAQARARRGKPVDLGPGDRERLEALGYLD